MRKDRLTEYDNLNDGSAPVVVRIGGAEIRIDNTDQLAEAVVKANHGTRRFLSSLTRVLQRSQKPGAEVLAQGIKDLVNKTQ